MINSPRKALKSDSGKGTQDEKRLERASAGLRLFARLRLSTHPEAIRKRLSDQIQIPQRARPLSDRDRDNYMAVYDDLLKDIHNNARMSWTIGTVFMTASFAIFGFVLTLWNGSGPHFLLVLSSAVVSLSLVWSWFFLNLFLADIGHKKYIIRSYVETVLDLPRYVHVHPSGRGRYRFILVPFIIHFLWVSIVGIRTFELHQTLIYWSLESFLWILVFISVGPLLLLILKGHWISVIEYDEAGSLKKTWAKSG